MKNLKTTIRELKDTHGVTLKRKQNLVEITTSTKTITKKYFTNSTGKGWFYVDHMRVWFTLENFNEVVEETDRAIEATYQEPQKPQKRQKRLVEVPAPVPAPEAGKHAKHEQIKTCIQADIPVYLVGEAGTGKNYTLQEIAKDLNLDFYFTNSVQQEYKITGFIDAGGHYHETEFYKAFTQGGLFFLDEIDASIPEVLVLLNAAIANRYFEFPNGRVDAHPDFRVVSAGNTVGSGANELYNGRLVLDAATLDRFVIIEFDYDRNIELSLANGDESLVNFVRSLRDFTKATGIRATFSYRCIITVKKLKSSGMDLKTILEIAVLKGLDKDTIKTLKVKNAGAYYYALSDIQTAS